jgi:phytoene synthase
VSIDSTLDRSWADRAAPPGSLRYFALLYTPAERRPGVAAHNANQSGMSESAQSANHDVAHTRLRWWRAEVDRLVNRNAHHPATRVLQDHHRGSLDRFAQLHELLVAADMDLARMTYLDLRELRAYCARSGGVLAELIAAELADERFDEATRSAIAALGVGIRQVEIIRDLRQDAYDGRLYLPLNGLEAHGIEPKKLAARETGTIARAVLEQLADAARTELARPIPDTRAHEALRPLRVLAALHRRLLERIVARDYDVGAERIDLGPFEKSWTAWREARRSR